MSAKRDTILYPDKCPHKVGVIKEGSRKGLVIHCCNNLPCPKHER